MENLLALLERDPTQEWIVWGEEDDKVFFIKAFPSQKAAINYRDMIEKMNIGATVSKSSSSLRIKSLNQPQPPEEKLENLEAVALAWKQISNCNTTVDKWLDKLEKHPDFLKTEKWIHHLPEQDRPAVQKTVESFLTKPQEIPVCTGDVCSLPPKEVKEEKKDVVKEENEVKEVKEEKKDAVKDEVKEEKKDAVKVNKKDEVKEDKKDAVKEDKKDEVNKDKKEEIDEPERSPVRRSRVPVRSTTSSSRTVPSRSRTSRTNTDVSPDQRSPEKGPRRVKHEQEDEREKKVSQIQTKSSAWSRPPRSSRR